MHDEILRNINTVALKSLCRASHSVCAGSEPCHTQKMHKYEKYNSPLGGNDLPRPNWQYKGREQVLSRRAKRLKGKKDR